MVTSALKAITPCQRIQASCSHEEGLVVLEHLVNGVMRQGEPCPSGCVVECKDSGCTKKECCETIFFRSHNPATGRVATLVPIASPDLVEEAVQAAMNAFETWSAMSIVARSNVLMAIADGIEARLDEVRGIVLHFWLSTSRRCMTWSGAPCGRVRVWSIVMSCVGLVVGLWACIMCSLRKQKAKIKENLYG